MKYCEDIIKAFETAIEDGLPNKQACDLLHINETTFYDWMENKAEFSKRIKEAQANRTQKLLSRIEDAGKKQWQASAWILERTNYEDFGNKEKRKHTIKGTLIIDDGCSDTKD